MSRELPILQVRETYFLDNSGITWRDIPVPSVEIIGQKYLGRLIISYDYTDIKQSDFTEFLWYTFERNIPVDFTEKFLREELGIRIDLYKILDRDPERLEEIRKIRKRKLMDDIEQSKAFDGIPKTPEEIKYAEAVNKAKLMIVSRTQKEYREKTEQDINLNGNLASIVIAPKED